MANGPLIKLKIKMLYTKKDKNKIIVQDMYDGLDRRIKNSISDCYYLNLGYWKNTNNTKKACEQMIDRVIQYSNLHKSQKLLDVGYGYGDQDIYIATKIPHLTIYGINITDNQVQQAQQKVIENNLSNRIFLQKGDAISLDFKNNSFDTIIAIESAFHFNTREKFFKEAFRTLKKNGILCLTDCLPTTKITNPEFLTNSKRFGIPIANQYQIDDYIKKLQKIGFSSITFEDITENVIPHSAAEITNLNGWRTEPIVNLPDNKNTVNELIHNFNIATTIEHYYIIKAVK